MTVKDSKVGGAQKVRMISESIIRDSVQEKNQHKISL